MNSPLVAMLRRRAIAREGAVLSKAESESGEDRPVGIQAKADRARILEVREDLMEIVDAWDELPEERVNNGVRATYLAGELSRLEGWR